MAHLAETSTLSDEQVEETQMTGSVQAGVAHRIAYLQARWQISVMSAPEKPLVCFTSRSTSTSGATGDFRSTACQRAGFTSMSCA